MTDSEKIILLERKLQAANKYIRWLSEEYRKEYEKNRSIN